MFWNAVLKLALYALEEFGDDIVKSTKNPFDDVALKAVVNALKLLKKIVVYKKLKNGGLSW